MSGFDAGLRALVTSSVAAAVKSAADGCDLLRTLDDLGWSELAADNFADAYDVLFTTLGRSGAASRALDLVVLDALGDALGNTAPGWADTAVAYPCPLGGLPAAQPPRAGGLRAVLVAEPPPKARLLVLLEAGASAGAVLLERDETEIAPLGGWDPGHGGFELRAAQPAPDRVTPLPGWPAALLAARRALAGELTGLCERMLEIAVAGARGRQQFGRPIGSYQAVRHKLAEARVWTSGAAALVRESCAPGATAATAATAKAYAGRAHYEVAARVLQTGGAMGLTWDFGLHQLVRRGFWLDALLGSAQQLTSAAGKEILTAPGYRQGAGFRTAAQMFSDDREEA